MSVDVAWHRIAGFCYLKHGAKVYQPSAGRTSALTKSPDVTGLQVDMSTASIPPEVAGHAVESSGNGNLSCAVLKNTDISGPNLGYEGPGKKVADCCGGCENFEGCKAAVHFE